MSTTAILTCNAGSHSLKCALFDAQNLKLLYRFDADRVHDSPTHLIKNRDGDAVSYCDKQPEGYEAALHYLFAWLKEHEPELTIEAAGHRIVHGGKRFTQAVRIDAEVKQQLEALIPLAPLHQSHNLALVEAVAKLYPDVMQVACFDTAFHRTQPWLAQHYALPHALAEKEAILRYGFHGLSYEYIASQLPKIAGDKANGRIVACHLGGGASMCAMQHRQSLATSMGFTALDGLMMATRCGDLDAGVILYLLQEKQMSPKQIESLLYKESGVLGVSGISSDMRHLHKSDDPRARQAIELFCYMAAKQLGALVMALGGLDALVFTGAMGCGDAAIRARICGYAKWLGLSIDENANAAHRTRISSTDSAIDAYVITADEELMIAQQTHELML